MCGPIELADRGVEHRGKWMVNDVNGRPVPDSKLLLF